MVDRKLARRRLTTPARRRIATLVLAQAYRPALRTIVAPGLAGAALDRHTTFRSTI